MAGIYDRCLDYPGRDNWSDSLVQLAIYKDGGNTLIHVSLFDVYQSEEVGDKNKSLAFSLKFQSDTTTLTDSEVDQNMDKILKSLKKVYGANQR